MTPAARDAASAIWRTAFIFAILGVIPRILLILEKLDRHSHDQYRPRIIYRQRIRNQLESMILSSYAPCHTNSFFSFFFPPSLTPFCFRHYYCHWVKPLPESFEALGLDSLVRSLASRKEGYGSTMRIMKARPRLLTYPGVEIGIYKMFAMRIKDNE